MHFVASVSDLSCQRNDLAYNQLGHATGVAEGRIEHANAMFGGIFQVDLVRANAETADYDEVAGRGQDSCGQFRFGADADYVDFPAVKVLDGMANDLEGK